MSSADLLKVILTKKKRCEDGVNLIISHDAAALALIELTEYRILIDEIIKYSNNFELANAAKRVQVRSHRRYIQAARRALNDKELDNIQVSPKGMAIHKIIVEQMKKTLDDMDNI